MSAQTTVGGRISQVVELCGGHNISEVELEMC